jgi:DNA-binding GntR family transcriptional regulator
LKQQGDETGAADGRRKGFLHADTVRRLREQIVSGELPPGTRLREVQLCETFGVSRTPVREALRTLAAEGLLELLPNRSVVVSELHLPELTHLFVVFASIEGLAGELACARITDGEITEIGSLLGAMIDRHAHGQRAAYLRLNQDIHRRTVEIAANPVLTSVWQSLVPRIERARAMPNLDRDRWTAALFEHSKMFTALQARDGPLLAQRTREHFLNALKVVPPDSSPE